MTRKQRLTETAREGLSQARKAVDGTAPYIDQAQKAASQVASGGFAQARRAVEGSASYIDQAQKVAAGRAPKLIKARGVVKESNAELRAASTALEDARAATGEALVALGELELMLYDGLLRRFAEAFSRIKNVHIADLVEEDLPPIIENYSTEFVKVDVKALAGLKAAVLTGGSGAAAGLITLASVTTFATASTGAAIGSLSGAAASNATLAWLGGGAIASGGMGVAGGTMILGGIVAAPVLAVGGLILRHQGRKALATAQADALSADKLVAEMAIAQALTEGITQRADQVIDTLQRLAGLARDRTDLLEWIIEEHQDYRSFTERERRLLASAVALVKTVRAVIDVPVIDDRGNVTDESRQLLDASQEVIHRHEEAS